MRAASSVLLALLVLAAAGCGGDSSVGTPEPTVTTQPEVATRVVSVYFLRDGKIAAAHRAVEADSQPAFAALTELLAGTSQDEQDAGLSSAIPPGTQPAEVSIEDGVASVSTELSQEASAQVVFTLTQFPTVERVTIASEQALTRADFADVTPAILVESPTVGATVSSPARLEGSASTFEANLQIEILDSEGRVLVKDFATATTGAPERGTFDASLPFELDEPGPGKLVVYESSAEDGSRLNVVEIPVELAP